MNDKELHPVAFERKGGKNKETGGRKVEGQDSAVESVTRVLQRDGVVPKRQTDQLRRERVEERHVGVF